MCAQIVAMCVCRRAARNARPQNDPVTNLLPAQGSATCRSLGTPAGRPGLCRKGRRVRTRGLRRGRPGLSWSSTIVISGIVTGDPIVETKTICDVRLALAPYCSAKMTVFAAAGIVIMTPLTSGSAKSREKSAGTTRRRTALADYLPRRQRRTRCGHPAREVDRIDERPWYI